MYLETKQKEHTRHKRELFQILVYHKPYKKKGLISGNT